MNDNLSSQIINNSHDYFMYILKVLFENWNKPLHLLIQLPSFI